VGADASNMDPFANKGGRGYWVGADASNMDPFANKGGGVQGGGCCTVVAKCGFLCSSPNTIMEGRFTENCCNLHSS